MVEVITPPSALKSFKDIPPPNFLEEKDGVYMLTTLSQRKLWKERPQTQEGKSDTALFINLQSERRYSFNINTLKTNDKYNNIYDREGFSSVIIVSGAMYEDNEQIQSTLKDAMISLKPGGSVFLFEKWGTDTGKEWRENQLKAVGLVEGNVLTSGRKVRGSTLWEAHMPREGLAHPIDLLENGPFWVKELLKEMKSSYEKEGYAIVDDTKLIKKLRHSKFPLKDIYLIRDRAGVIISSTLCPTQTCKFEIDTNGNRYTLNACGEDHFSPIQQDVTKSEPKKTVEIHHAGDEVILERTCRDCNEHLIGTYFQDKGQSLELDIHCPHHGLVEHKVLAT